MEDNLPTKTVFSEEEKKIRQRDKAIRETKIARTKAGCFRNEVLAAYHIVDSLRFDYLGDTAFRDKITHVKCELEAAIDDFLLSDQYWERRIKEIKQKSPKEYDEYL